MKSNIAKHLVVRGAVAAVTISSLSLGLIGSAHAASANGGSNWHQSGYSANWDHNKSEYCDEGTGGTQQGTSWSDWSPQAWHSQGKSYDQWQGRMTSWMDKKEKSWGWKANGQSNWHPGSGTNWSDDWNNWDPKVWRDAGMSYEQWHSQFMTNWTKNAPKWMAMWNQPGKGSNNESKWNKKNTNWTASQTWKNDRKDDCDEWGNKKVSRADKKWDGAKLTSYAK